MSLISKSSAKTFNSIKNKKKRKKIAESNDSKKKKRRKFFNQTTLLIKIRHYVVNLKLFLNGGIQMTGLRDEIDGQRCIIEKLIHTKTII